MLLELAGVMDQNVKWFGECEGNRNVGASSISRAWHMRYLQGSHYLPSSFIHLVKEHLHFRCHGKIKITIYVKAVCVFKDGGV